MLLSGMPARYVAMVTGVFMTVLVVTIILTSYTRRINVNAEVITDPHTINLFSPQQGMITRQFVQVGQAVAKGDAIYAIDASRTTTSGNVSDAARTSIQGQQTEITQVLEKLQQDKETAVASLKQQLQQAMQSHKTLQQQLETARSNMETMRKNMQGYEQYLKEGLVTKEQLSARQTQFYQQQTQYQAILNQVNQQEMEMTRLRSDIATRSTTYDNQISEYQNQKRALDKQMSEADASGLLIINSQSSGKVTSMSVTPGQMVNVGDYLAQLVPTTDYQYRLVLWIPNSSVPYVSAGEQINIRYAAFPYEKFGQFDGKILSVAAAPATVQEMAAYANAPHAAVTGASESYYKAIAEVSKHTFAYEGKALTLSSGMQAQVTLFLERRPLYQWMLAPFYDMKRSVMGAVDGK